MNNIVLVDTLGNIIKASLLFTHFDLTFKKNYIVYLIDNDLLAASYHQEKDKYIINNDLTTAEYDMIDRTINERLGEAYA